MYVPAVNEFISPGGGGGGRGMAVMFGSGGIAVIAADAPPFIPGAPISGLKPAWTGGFGAGIGAFI
jgi:hypothetical protein